MKVLFPYMKSYKKQFIIGPICKLIEAILELLLPTFMAYMINDGILQKDQHTILFYGILMFIMVIAGFIFAMICQYEAAVASQGFGTDVRNALFQKLQVFSYEDMEHFGSDSFMNRLSQDVNQLQVAVAMMIRLVVRAPFIIIGAIIMAMWMDYTLGWILLAIIPFLFMLLFGFMKWSTPLYQAYQQKLDAFSYRIQAQFSNIKAMRVFQAEETEFKQTKQQAIQLHDQMYKIGKGSAFLQPGMALILNIAILLLLVCGVLQIDEGMNTGVLVAMINYATSILSALQAISNLIIIFSKAAVSAKRVEEIFLYESKQKQETMSCHFDTNVVCTFDHVSYKYEHGTQALQNISFSIYKQEVFGIIGGSGAGKSTLLKLMTNLLSPTKGTIKLFQTPLTRIEEKILRQDIAYVSQQDTLFHMTVYDNLCFGLQKVSQNDIKKALKAAQAIDFVEALKDGLQTMVAEKGSNFSGGQKQRLCIARALLRNPKLLILDDATSALDYKTESKFKQALKQLYPQTTIVLVSQRSATLQGCNRILVLKQGKMVGLDTPARLENTCEAYKEIYTSQQKGDA